MYNNLRRIRLEQNLTCKEMADLLGYANRSVYSRKELGKIPIKIEEAKRIANILGSTMDKIFCK